VVLLTRSFRIKVANILWFEQHFKEFAHDISVLLHACHTLVCPLLSELIDPENHTILKALKFAVIINLAYELIFPNDGVLYIDCFQQMPFSDMQNC
jgi:hypothetical protein